MKYWKLKGSTDTAKTVKFVGDFIQHGTDLYDLETFFERFEIGVKPLEAIVNDASLYSDEDINLLFSEYGGHWEFAGKNYERMLSGALNWIPAKHLISGGEVAGTIAGYEFTSTDKTIYIKTVDGVKGMFPAVLYVTTDRKFVVFY